MADHEIQHSSTATAVLCGECGGFMFILAVVFAGKGISALQEAGEIPLDPVVLPSIDLLGVYPNYQGLSAQGLMIILVCIMIIRDNRKQAKLKF